MMLGTNDAWLRFWLAVGALTAFSACAAGEIINNNEGGNAGEGGSGASGGEASTGGGGAAQQGGGGSSTGMDFPCGIDCSTIETPDCSVAECNMGQHQGTVGECIVVPAQDGASCEDGQFCTVADTCQAGVCVGGPPNDCGLVPDACQQSVCDEPSQTCTTTATPNGDPCTPDDLCSVNATCQNGLCLGQPKDCFFAPVPNECHVAICNPMTGVCDPEPGNDGMGCIDQNDLCTDNKACSAGQCLGGGPKDCSALTQGCVEGQCDAATGQCFGMPLMPGQMCSAAADDCNIGLCDMNGMCQPQPSNEGGTCEDGNSCTVGETCTAGVCGGGTMVNIVTYFSEDFSDNSAGWTLDTEWQIGSAVSSPATGACGNGDPGTDHTVATTDNGVAGAVIGGNVSTSQHSFYYVTSPPIDTSTVVGPLWLSFYRWLNSDYTRFMDNRVEVFDGTSWTVLWNSGPSPNIEDMAWTQQSFDVGPYKNSQMRLRFGYEIGSSGVYTCSGWNLDDVVLSNAVCP